MGLDIHTVDVYAGSTLSEQDRVKMAILSQVANAAGGSAGAAVTTAVAIANLPPVYNVQVETSQACFVAIANRTQSGFNVVMTPTASGVTLAAGTFDVLVLA